MICGADAPKGCVRWRDSCRIDPIEGSQRLSLGRAARWLHRNESTFPVTIMFVRVGP
jgi:hypothetical protein